jgi:hypothetical protein
MVDGPLLRVSNRFREATPLPCKVDFGTWHLTTWQNRGVLQHGARLVPDHAPWRDLFQALDEAGAPLPSHPVSELDEADAIVATCWLYGSYAYVLTTGELYPPFRADPSLSRISDHEMKRINLEFSSGLAAWWSDRRSDPHLVNRRSRAVLRLLPMPWRARRKNPDFDQSFAVVSGERMVSRLTQVLSATVDALPTENDRSLRLAANWAVNDAYRNGPVESLHAGHWSHGSEVPGFVRLYAAEIDEIAGTSSWRLAVHIAARRHPGGLPLLQVAARVAAPSIWSLALDTAPVEYLGLAGAGSLEARLRWLSTRSPIFAGPIRSAGEWS